MRDPAAKPQGREQRKTECPLGIEHLEDSGRAAGLWSRLEGGRRWVLMSMKDGGSSNRVDSPTTETGRQAGKTPKVSLQPLARVALLISSSLTKRMCIVF